MGTSTGATEPDELLEAELGAELKELDDEPAPGMELDDEPNTALEAELVLSEPPLLPPPPQPLATIATNPARLADAPGTNDCFL